MTDGRAWPHLQRIAGTLFYLVASSSSCERNFSSMAFIHSKARNKLGVNTVEKLVYVRTNQTIIDNIADGTKRKRKPKRLQMDSDGECSPDTSLSDSD